MNKERNALNWPGPSKYANSKRQTEKPNVPNQHISGSELGGRWVKIPSSNAVAQ